MLESGRESSPVHSIPAVNEDQLRSNERPDDGDSEAERRFTRTAVQDQRAARKDRNQTEELVLQRGSQETVETGSGKSNLHVNPPMRKASSNNKLPLKPAI